MGVFRGTGCMIALLAPPEGGKPTGGHLVNRMLTAGDGIELVESDSARELAGYRAILVDSLYLSEPTFLSRRRRAAVNRASPAPRGGEAPIGLLAHSLPSLIPGAPVQSRREWLRYERVALGELDFAIAPSRFMRDALIRRGVAPPRISVIPPAPIVDGRGSPARRPVADAVQLLTVANWSHAKGIHLLGNALARLRTLSWRWTVVGDCRNSYGERLLKELHHSLEGGRLQIVKSLPPQRLAGYYESADLFVLPSLMESYGIAFAEAITYRVPVLASKTAAVAEVVGDAGVLIRAGDQTAFTDELAALITDTPRRLALRARAAVRARIYPCWGAVRTMVAEAAELAAVGAH